MECRFLFADLCVMVAHSMFTDGVREQPKP